MDETSSKISIGAVSAASSISSQVAQLKGSLQGQIDSLSVRLTESRLREQRCRYRDRELIMRAMEHLRSQLTYSKGGDLDVVQPSAVEAMWKESVEEKLKVRCLLSLATSAAITICFQSALITLCS